MNIRVLLISVVSVLALVTVAACAADGPAGPTTPGQDAASPSPAAAGDEAVDIVDFGYEPATIEVSAGTVVTWTNTGAAPHTVTFDEGGFDSGQLAAGATFEQAFDEPGSHSYSCTIHPTMTGVVNVSP